ncbi:unnamed protein product, partial [Hydatigera taeniaeformis]|uniref:Chitin-binding type-1 domain-containing protein n=1 Tax=Hydatigena taeniaeformis TaxID=6205 RepID=A0A0R3WJU6_HYDTA
MCVSEFVTLKKVVTREDPVAEVTICHEQAVLPALLRRLHLLTNVRTTYHTSKKSCYSGGKTGYGCHSGVCNYTCSKSQCRGFNNSVFSHKGIKEKWGSGALGKQGCYGGNCGYWSGCKDGKCNGFYDFTQCQGGECMSGAFHGYGCLPGGSCQVICLNDVCHSVDNYGQIYTLPMGKDGVAEYANTLSGYAYDPAMMYVMPGPDYPVPQPPSALPSVHTMDSEVLKH